LFVTFDGALRLTLRSAFAPNQGETLADPENVCIIVADASRALVESYGGAPEGQAFAFLGVPSGAPFWLLPEGPQVGIPWFGASTEGVPPTRYANEELYVALAEVQAPQGGNVAVWTANFVGEPRPLFSTVEGLLVTRFAVGAHMHFNWSFSAAGEYRLGFRAEGTRSDGELEQSPMARFRFLVGL
jgi:surface-anchored protein